MDVRPITVALQRAERGEAGAADELWQLVYGDLKRIASGRLARLKPGETLQATALVHEAWIRLQSDEQQDWDGRAHFFGAAARSMRNILVDQARSKQRLCRNSGVRPVALEEGANIAAGEHAEKLDMLALDEALTVMGKEFERPTRIVMLRFFAGLTVAEIAEMLDITTRTVDRDFLFARAWLRRHMER